MLRTLSMSPCKRGRRQPVRAKAAGEPAACRHRRKQELPRSFLQNSLFQLLLALDAMPGPGNRLQAFGVDFLAAGDALSELAFAQSLQCAIHHLQQLAVIVALMK